LFLILSHFKEVYMSDLTLGSHLVTPRIGYQHHGLFIGNEQVIHFTSNSRIETVSLSEFTEGNGYDTRPFHSKFSRNEIVTRALSRLGNDHYNVIFNNCEHFVAWCIHDKPISKQVRTHAALTSSLVPMAISSGLTSTPTLAGLTMAEITAATGATLGTGTTGFALLSTTPIIPAAIVGFGVFKLIQFLSD
jgi:hypothetical protein